MEWWVWALLAGGTTATVAWAIKARAALNPRSIDYPIDPARPWGKVWRDTRPPGLPDWARRASVEEAARPHIEVLGNAKRLGSSFTRSVVAIADKESSMTFARPANNFYNVSSDRKITAWGAFQWNDGAWDRFWERRTEIDARVGQGPMLTGPVQHPWESSSWEELAWPIEYYARLWRTVIARGGDAWAASRALFMWHSGPTRFRRFRDLAAQYGWREAWERIDEGLTTSGPKYRQERRQAEEELAKWGVEGPWPYA